MVSQDMTASAAISHDVFCCVVHHTHPLHHQFMALSSM
jgi:hypothetical protein